MKRNIRATTPQFTIQDYKLDTLHANISLIELWEQGDISLSTTKKKKVWLQTCILKIPKNYDIFALPEKKITSWLSTLLSHFLFQAEMSTILSKTRILLNHKSEKNLDARAVIKKGTFQL